MDSNWVECVSDSVCDSCLSEYFTTCPECGEIVEDDDTYYITSVQVTVCSDCYTCNYHKCKRCEERYPEHDVIFTDEGDELCEKCHTSLGGDE
jgi:hypothetical protein